MGLKGFCSFLVLHCLFLLVLSLGVYCQDSEVSVKLVTTPHAISNKNSATFAFQVLVGANGNGSICSNCSTTCKLDHGISGACDSKRISYTRLVDGNHSFEVCTNGSPGVSCASYDWTIDRVNPTAHIEASTSFTSASHVSVLITFSEPCIGSGGFRCSSIHDCNLLVYGAGAVMPNTLKVVQPNLKYSITVSVSERNPYGRLVLVMDKNFCTDSAGNLFTRTENSSFFLHYDRRSVFVNLRTHIPERLLQIDTETRTVLATNQNRSLVVYLYFTEPVMNSSTEILNALNANQGSIVPISGNSFGLRRFGYQLMNIAEVAVVTISLHSDLVITRQGTPVAPVSPVTFLYDSQRPAVRLSTRNMRTKEKSILVLIKFMKPVFGFNSSHISISGAHLQSFQETSRSSYTLHIEAAHDVISIYIPENVTTDVSGNRNKASDILQVKHYSVPIESLVLSSIATAVFALTTLVAGFLTVSTTSLISVGAFSRPSSILSYDSARNLFRIASHIQVFALSRWLAVTWPVEYYELARGLQWSIPYFNLPWERGDNHFVMTGSSSPMNRQFRISEVQDSLFFEGVKPKVDVLDSAAKVYGLPLTAMEYRSYFENQSIMPEAQYILDPQSSHGWRDFSRSMFWLAVIGGSLILLHLILLMILKLKKKNDGTRKYGALTFPRFEIFLVILALPCFCEASAALVKGGTSSGMVVGVLLLSLVAFLLLSFLLFLSFGITCGKLLQYKEIHKEGQKFHWYHEIIRATLGPGKRGQWTWKNRANSIYLTILGPLFEDLRGPPKYMLSQISGSNLKESGDRIIASDDEIEDSEPPFIQKLFGILRIYYTLLECIKRVALGILAGAYLENWSSKTPTIALLSITSFQLFFMVLKKPFIKKKVQLVEIISISCEVTIFAVAFVLLDREFSVKDERIIGISMLLVFLLSFSVQMINEWYSLFRQIKHLDPVKNSFLCGLSTALIGFLLFFAPPSLIKNMEKRFPIDSNGETGDPSSSTDRAKSSGDKPWLKQIRELARSSLSKEGSKTTSSSDPSTSKPRWSGFWKPKRSGSSSASTSADFKVKPRGLYKELEDIFAHK